MAHTRTAIRNNISTTLTGLSTTAGRIYLSRVNPIAAPKLPCILVYTDAEAVQYRTVGMPRTQVRFLDVKVELYVKGSTNYDTQLDDIAAEIEAALYADVTRGGLAQDTRIVQLNTQFSGDGDQPVGVGMMTVRVEYHTTEGSPITL